MKDNEFEIELRTDGSIQVRLATKQGFIDLVFVDEKQFLGFVAGQHVDTAKQVLSLLPRNIE